MHCTIKEESACKNYLLGLHSICSKGFEGVDGLTFTPRNGKVKWFIGLMRGLDY